MLGGAVVVDAQRASSSRSAADVDHRLDVHRLIVRSGEPFPYQVDGDDVGDTEQLDIEFVPDALTIVVPYHGARRAPTSGTFVMIASTPAAASVATSSGSSTVHTPTRRPAACAAATSAAVAGERGPAIGIQPRVPVLGRDPRRGQRAA